MARAHRQELRGLCEAFRSALQARVQLTCFRMDVIRQEGRTESIVLRPEATELTPSRPAPLSATMTVPIRDKDGLLGKVTIEDTSQASLSPSTRDEVERLARIYAPTLRAYVRGGKWPPGVPVDRAKRTALRRR